MSKKTWTLFIIAAVAFIAADFGIKSFVYKVKLYLI